MPINIEGYEPPNICEKTGCDAESVVEREVQHGDLPGRPLRLCQRHDDEAATRQRGAADDLSAT